MTGYNCGFGYADNYYAYRYSSKKSVQGYYDLYTNREISALDISGDANDQYPTARSVHDMDFKHQWAIDIDYGSNSAWVIIVTVVGIQMEDTNGLVGKFKEMSTFQIL